ncbi:hypothetical protein Hanom_Chr01g00079741 [Helianthus anomalus]
MAQLRSGACRFKRLGDLQQPAAQPVEQVENVVAPAQTERLEGKLVGEEEEEGVMLQL